MDLALFIVGFYFFGVGLVSRETSSGKVQLFYGLLLVIAGIIVQGGFIPQLGR